MGTNLKHRFIDESFDRLQIEKYNLSIRFAPDGFSFCVREVDQPQILALGDASFNAANMVQLMWEIENAISLEPSLDGNFHEVTCIFDNFRYCLIPDIPGLSQTKEEIFNYTFEECSTESIYYTEHSDFSIAFAIPQAIEKAIKKRYPNARFISPIDPILKIKKGDPTPLISIMVFDRICYITLLIDGKVKSTTAHKIGKETDVAFHTIYLLKLLDLDPLNTTVQLAGDEKICTSAANILTQYIKNVSIYNVIGENIVFPKSFDKKLLINYSPLIRQSICE